MNLKILNNCIGCGACAIISPEVFEINGKTVTVNQSKIDSCPDLCIDAAITCPVHAIDICD